MTSRSRPQSHMDDKIIEDPELEKMLEEREEMKHSVSAFNKLDKDVKARIAGIEHPTPYRVGRFVIDRSTVPAKQVSFEIQESMRISIKLAGEE